MPEEAILVLLLVKLEDMCFSSKHSFSATSGEVGDEIMLAREWAIGIA